MTLRMPMVAMLSVHARRGLRRWIQPLLRRSADVRAGYARLALAHDWLFEPGPWKEIVVRAAVGRLAVPDRFAELLDRIVAERSAALHQLRLLRPEADRGFQPEAFEEEIMRTQAQLRWATAVRHEAEEVLRRPPAPRVQAQGAKRVS